MIKQIKQFFKGLYKMIASCFVTKEEREIKAIANISKANNMYMMMHEADRKEKEARENIEQNSCSFVKELTRKESSNEFRRGHNCKMYSHSANRGKFGWDEIENIALGEIFRPKRGG